MRITLRQLQIFVAVAKYNSTAAAGVSINLSQSATSAALKELERLLSVKLFDRRGKRLVLNSCGRALLPMASALLDGVQQIEKIGSADRKLNALRIGASTTIGNYVLPTILRNYWRGEGGGGYPKVYIKNTSAICKDLSEFTIDVGLIEGPSHSCDLNVEPWLKDELIIVGSPDVYENLREASPYISSIQGATLAEQVWLLREAGSGTREVTDFFLLPYLHKYQHVLELGNSEAIKHAAAEGLGLACLSEWVVSDMLATGRLRRIKTNRAPMMRQCYIVQHREKHETASLREFKEFIINGGVI